MADEKRTKIVIPRNGISTGEQQVRGLDTAITNKVVDALGGKKTITRASHVEPGSGLSVEALHYIYQHCHVPVVMMTLVLTGNPPQIAEPYESKWFADLLPVGGPVLGPFDSRPNALAAEEKWLHEHHIPVCKPCRE